MALPKLNNVTYDLTLPSTGQKIEYRPFLVKEQKALMIAQESGDNAQIEKAFAKIINDCVIDDVNPYTLPMFDVEYIFLRIRGKSVGEKVKLSVLCPDDENTRVDVEVNLEEVDVQMQKDHTNIVELSSDIYIGFRPEDISLDKNSEIFAKINIDLLENLGSEKIIYGNLNGREIRVKSNKNITDKNITIYLPKNKLYLFDNDKNRIRT